MCVVCDANMIIHSCLFISNYHPKTPHTQYNHRIFSYGKDITSLGNDGSKSPPNTSRAHAPKITSRIDGTVLVSRSSFPRSLDRMPIVLGMTMLVMVVETRSFLLLRLLLWIIIVVIRRLSLVGMIILCMLCR